MSSVSGRSPSISPPYSAFAPLRTSEPMIMMLIAPSTLVGRSQASVSTVSWLMLP